MYATTSKSPFPKYIANVSPAQRRTIDDYIARIRARLVRVLEGQQMEVPPASIPATRAVHSNLTFVDIAVEELRPRYMRGYGDVPPEAAAELNGIVGELQTLVTKLDEFVSEDTAQDLQARLQRLQNAGADLSQLRTLERIITNRGLVEFRSTLAMLLDRVEDNSFEIAVFGRVSSGKSSLLNAIIGSKVLPVGVTPITTVPTRLVYGPAPAVKVWFANRPAETDRLDNLAEFVAEQHNPGNTRQVTRIVAEIPSPALREGVVFVDTPGLGSLATAGAAETIAYLPRCDLGVMLIDGASTLTPDDLGTIQTLYQAGTPANVLLSKADLLSVADLEKITTYVKQHIRSELGLDLSVHPISTVPTRSEMVSQWFEQEIAPLFEQRQELRLRSIQRKIGALRQSVGAALAAVVRRTQHQEAASAEEADAMEGALRRATAQYEELQPRLERLIETLPEALQPALKKAAMTLATSWEGGREENAVDTVRESMINAMQQRANGVRDMLLSVAQQTGEVLRTTASKLELPDAPAKEELAGMVRDMPAPDIGRLQVQVSRPVLTRALGKAAANRNLERQLRAQAGAQLSAALQTYGALLKSWGRGGLQEMQHRFEQYASAYRAHIDRSFGAQLGADEQAAILRDLEAISMTGADVVEHVSR